MNHSETVRPFPRTGLRDLQGELSKSRFPVMEETKFSQATGDISFTTVKSRCGPRCPARSESRSSATWVVFIRNSIGRPEYFVRGRLFESSAVTRPKATCTTSRSWTMRHVDGFSRVIYVRQ